jgi:hypothetical protein
MWADTESRSIPHPCSLATPHMHIFANSGGMICNMSLYSIAAASSTFHFPLQATFQTFTHYPGQPCHSFHCSRKPPNVLPYHSFFFALRKLCFLVTLDTPKGTSSNHLLFLVAFLYLHARHPRCNSTYHGSSATTTTTSRKLHHGWNKCHQASTPRGRQVTAI